MSPQRPVASVTALLIGSACAITLGAEPLAALYGPSARVFDQVNRVREAHHLTALRASSELAQVAQRHVEDMVRRGYVAHVNPDGRNPLERVQAAGIEGMRLLAENIGTSSVRSDRVAEVIEEWLHSPLHRENVLNPAFNTTGVGAAEAPDGRTIYVQLFATF